MRVIRSRQVRRGEEQHFSGNVKIEMLYDAEPPAMISASLVTFEPRARTAWHYHPLGQLLIVTNGKGIIKAEGEEAVEIKEGDVIWTPPGQRHWHGASPTLSMTHIAIQEKKDGKNIEWLEKVSDNEYDNTWATIGSLKAYRANDDKELRTLLKMLGVLLPIITIRLDSI
ncbi:cupin domain-containing protein [Sulfolobus sp. A20-N-F8]|uniref:(R)-mandelonitrile lyase n=1 Tax=Saccharolobus sp. A20 TaxID=1891280 RepID=UPI0009F67AA7|nr:cupin domain-containing protein [Sulfolobus sp. A20]TRM74856.1 cupin domain-containing protein [Sulfolobus sp. A20-N-F8]TRM79505.1 cupin domain-containing protein [Sulfolobus sp. B5]TRN04086.1 cupin domain-containing protein [Sulfolobus sp. F1]